MKKKSLHLSLVWLISLSIVASPPPPPGFAPPTGPSGFEAPQELGGFSQESNTASPAFTPSTPEPETSSEESQPGTTPAQEESQEQQAEQLYQQEEKADEALPGMQSADQALEQEQDTEQEGVKNFNVEGSGNWLLKRVWWEKTEDVYEEIKTVFNQVLETRGQFINARNKLDRELDIFYGEMGLEQGPLHDIITHILELMEKRRAAQGDVLTPTQEALVKKTEEKEPVLAQLKLDVKAIQVVEDKLDQALTTLFKQIDVCNEYEQKAWNNFKDIARELNDKEARKSYYQTQAILDDIKKIQAYLNGAFASYFDQTVQLARDHAQKITANMQNLRNQGIDLQKEAAALEADRDQPKKPSAAVKKEEPKKELGFFARIAEFFTSLVNKFFSLFSSEVTAVKARTKKAEKQVEQAVDKKVTEVKQKTQQVKKDVQQAVTRVEKEVDTLAQDIQKDYQAGLFDDQDFAARIQSESAQASYAAESTDTQESPGQETMRDVLPDMQDADL